MTAGAKPQLFPNQSDLALVHDTSKRAPFDFLSLDFVVIVPVSGEVLSWISPAQACQGGDAFALTVIGSGFSTAAVVKINGAVRTTVFVSGTKLTATITASDLLAIASLTVTVVDGVVTLGPNYLNVVVCPTVSAGHGPVQRPQFDHLADVRANDNQLNRLQAIIATNDVLRRVSRQ